MRTYTIELRADFTEDSKHDILLEVVRTSARDMLATAMMLKDKRDPQMALQTGDMFQGNTEIMLFGGDGEDGEDRGE